MNAFLGLISSFVSSMKTGKEEPVFETDSTSVELPVSLSGPTVMVSSLLGKTAAISGDYEFAKIEVGVAFMGLASDKPQIRKLADIYATEVLERQLESRFKQGREPEVLPDIPGSVAYGQLTMTYSKTFRGPRKYAGFSEMLKVEVTETLPFEGNRAAFVKALIELDKSLNARFADREAILLAV